MRRNSRVSPELSQLDPGTKWVFDGQMVEIDGLDSPSTVNVRVEATGELRRIPVAGLSSPPSDSPVRDAGAISDEEWSRIAVIAADLRPLIQRARVPHEVLDKVASTHGISVRHVQRLLAKFRASPRVSTLANRKVGRPEAMSFLRPEVEGIISHAIRKQYLRRERVSQNDIVERVRSLCRRCGLPPPSRNTVRRRIARHRNYEGDVRRLGAKQARQRWEPRPGRLLVEHPLDMVQIDHTLVDLVVLNDDRREVLGRPWLTVAMDVATRVVLGFYLSMDAPSAVSVGLCIAHAVLPKPEDARDPGLWPMFGKMKKIYVDNGRDLVSSAIRRGCEEHGISLETRPLGKPHYGGHIERLMGSLMRLVHGLPGTTFSSIRQKGDYDSERKATLTLLELHEWMLQAIGRIYHTRRHRALGVPPSIAWARAWRSDEGRLVLPPWVAQQEAFRLDFLPFEQRRLQRTGIQLRRSRYWSESLTYLVHPDRTVQVHYDPYALDRVWVRTPENRIIEAHAVAGPAAGQHLQPAMDVAERTQAETQKDIGFTECDRLEAMAASIKRARIRRGTNSVVGSSESNRSKMSNRTPGLEEASPKVPLDRSSVHVKRFVE